MSKLSWKVTEFSFFLSFFVFCLSGATSQEMNPIILHITNIQRRKYESLSMKVKSLSHVRLFATPWTVAYQAPLSMGFSRHQYWSGLPFPSPGDLPDPRVESVSPTLQADALLSEPPGKPKKCETNP